MLPHEKHTTGFCIYIDTVCEGPVPVEKDEKGKPVVYETEAEAQHVIAEDTIDRLQQFLDGERDFDDATTVEEYITQVTVLPDGSIIDESGARFLSQRGAIQPDFPLVTDRSVF